MVKIILLSIYIVILNPFHSHAGYTSCGSNCYLADSSSSEDVQSAIDAAILSSGGTVNIPSGSSSWTETVSKTITKNLTIKGSGKDSTIITKSGTNAYGLFDFQVNNGISFEIANLKLVNSNDTTSNHFLLQAYGGTSNLIIHDIIFDRNSIVARGAIIGNPNDTILTSGVLYNCTFENGGASGQDMSFNGPRPGGSAPWYGGTTFGSSDAFFVEDCTFSRSAPGDGAFDAYTGAKGVFRYNTIYNTTIGWHGNDSGYPSTHSFEVYGNTFTANQSMPFSIHIRGGTALIFQNSFDSHFPQTFTLASYRSCQAQGIDGLRCNGSGLYDGNTEGMSGYPCYQQVGTTGIDGITSAPVMEWNNNWNGGTNNMSFDLNANFVPPLCSDPSMADHVKEGRDYLNHNTCPNVTYSQCATFWTTSGEYRSANYIPYPYPHPLRLFYHLRQSSGAISGGSIQ